MKLCDVNVLIYAHLLGHLDDLLTAPQIFFEKFPKQEKYDLPITPLHALLPRPAGLLLLALRLIRSLPDRGIALSLIHNLMLSPMIRQKQQGGSVRAKRFEC